MRKGLSPEAKRRRIEFHIDARTSPENVRFVEAFDWKYIAIHPVADESRWFEKFGESPEICSSADFYWQFDGDVAFLEIATKKLFEMSLDRRRAFEGEKFTARWKGHVKYGLLHLMAWVEDDLVYSRTVERVMRKFYEIHRRSDLFETFYLKKEAVAVK